MLRLVLSCGLVLGSAGCSGLQFVDDRALALLSPRDDATVTVPLTIRWRLAHDEPELGTFAVYVDRVPPRSGQRDDDKKGVFLTTSTSLVLTRDDLPPRVGTREGERNKHEITVVLLDAHGRRLGERAALVTVEVRR